MVPHSAPRRDGSSGSSVRTAPARPRRCAHLRPRSPRPRRGAVERSAGRAATARALRVHARRARALSEDAGGEQLLFFAELSGLERCDGRRGRRPLARASRSRATAPMPAWTRCRTATSSACSSRRRSSTNPSSPCWTSRSAVSIRSASRPSPSSSDDTAASGVTVVFSSHQLDLVEDVCQDVVVIDHGRIVLAGVVEDLKTANSRPVAADRRERGAVDARAVERTVTSRHDGQVRVLWTRRRTWPRSSRARARPARSRGSASNRPP